MAAPSCGCWIYSGVFDGENKANGRDARGKYGHGWGYAWPMDRRILYNRASAAPDGTPWSERKKLVWWDEAKRRVDRRRRRRLYEEEAARLRRAIPTKAATKRSPATRRSSCIPTASAGSTSPRD